MNITELTERRERILRKRDSEDGEAPAGAPEAEPAICDKSGCGKPKGHTGRCKGPQPKRKPSAPAELKLSASERARMGAAARWAKAGKQANLGPGPSKRKAVARPRPSAPTEMQGGGKAKVEFVIAYADNEVEVKLRGDSMEKLLGAMEMIGKIQR